MLSYHRAVGLHREGDHVVGARLRDLRDGTEQDVEAPVTVIAAGPWSAEVAAMGGITYQMQLSRGAMIGFNGRWTSHIINRLHWPGDGDIFIPLGAHGVAGTTSARPAIRTIDALNPGNASASWMRSVRCFRRCATPWCCGNGRACVRSSIRR